MFFGLPRGRLVDRLKDHGQVVLSIPFLQCRAPSLRGLIRMKQHTTSAKIMARAIHNSSLAQAAYCWKPRGASHIAVLRVAKVCQLGGEVWFRAGIGSGP